MNENFEKWWVENSGTFPMSLSAKNARKIWNAAIESTIEKRFYCNLDFDGDYDAQYNQCVFDCNMFTVADCDRAMLLTEEGKPKTDCEHYREAGKQHDRCV